MYWYRCTAGGGRRSVAVLRPLVGERPRERSPDPRSSDTRQTSDGRGVARTQGHAPARVGLWGAVAIGVGGMVGGGIAARLSSASAINATLYGSARMTYVIAQSRELPAELERLTWNQPVEGLFITAGATIVLANMANLASIATMGSAGFLIIFAVVTAGRSANVERTGIGDLDFSVGSRGVHQRACRARRGAEQPSAASVLGAMVALSFAYRGRVPAREWEARRLRASISVELR